mmetsp:Transcript_34194/g.100672  ORF Transcript_34194/g.100672 Transcript_34194/m.100672 type:complete len:96 (-) Transcript_34194:64-351(-)
MWHKRCALDVVCLFCGGFMLVDELKKRRVRLPTGEIAKIGGSGEALVNFGSQKLIEKSVGRVSYFCQLSACENICYLAKPMWDFYASQFVSPRRS